MYKYNQLIPLEVLEKLPTKRLLAYYKSRRKRVLGSCEFGWECYGYIDLRDDEVEPWLKHIDDVKSMLDKREHIK